MGIEGLVENTLKEVYYNEAGGFTVRAFGEEE